MFENINDNQPAADRAMFDPRHPTFFFDFSSVLQHCESLQRHPERMALMCQSEVHHIAPRDLMVPDSKGFYLVVRSQRGAAADLLVEEINEALIKRLFGTRPPPEAVSMVRPVASGTIVELDVAARRPAPARPDPGKRPEPKPVRPEPVACFGHPGFKPGLLPLFNLQRHAPPAYLCGPVLHREGRKLFGAEALRYCHQQYRPAVDIAMLQFCLRQMPSSLPNKFVGAMATSVSYETLGWSRSRQLYQDVLKAARVAEKGGLLIKIDDIPLGTPASRLKDVVGALKPFVRQILVQLPSHDNTLMHGDTISAHGVCGTLAPRMTATEIVHFARWLRHTATAQQAISCVLGAEQPSEFCLLHNAGVGFAAPYPEGVNAPLRHLPREATHATTRRAA